MNKNHKVIVVAGPTSSGKSDFAVEMALKYNGEIISADSRQIYKSLDISTGKITKKEMKGIPHHMLDISNLDDNFSVADYKRLALPILEDILARGKTPIICGGTGQYIDCLIFNQEIPHVEPNKKLREELEKETTEQLVAYLTVRDPVRLLTIDTHNRPRLIRALEIIDSLGSVPQQTTPILRHITEFYIMNGPRELLRERITRRLEKRLLEGILDEVKNSRKKILSLHDKIPSLITWKKFGLEYVTIGKYLEEKIDEEEMKQEIITKSMQYAKRQQTWNKKYLPFAKIVEITK